MTRGSAPPRPQEEVACVHCGERHSAAFSHCPRTGKPLGTGRALLGRTIGDRYRVVGMLGEGGMGAVYVAEHVRIGRKVALKRLHPELTTDERAVRRFQLEARAAAATGHEHIVDVLDMGFAEDGAPFLVMEYLRGQSLAEVLRREHRLPPERACAIIGQVLDALGAVHRQQIVHRDLKPDNIFLTRRSGRHDYVKVLDFGVSKMRGERGASSLTGTGVMLGTPYYMSPEQARGTRDLDHRVDLYAVGVILYELLTGRLPFTAPNYHALMQAILTQTPPALTSLLPGLDAQLAAHVHRAMAREPGHRFRTARDMLLSLVPFGAEDSGVQDPDGVYDTAPPPRWGAGQASTEAAPSPVPEPPPSNLLRQTTEVGAGGAWEAAPPGARSAGDEPRAPRPDTLRGRARRFEAHSDDWRDGSAEEPASRLASRTPPKPPVFRGPLAVTRTSLPGLHVRGSLLSDVLASLTEARGQAFADHVMELLPSDRQAQVRGVILPVTWFPAELLGDVLQTAESLAGDEPGSLSRHLGSLIAARELTTTHRVLSSTSPQDALGYCPVLLRGYHSQGDARIDGDAATPAVVMEGLGSVHPLHAELLAGLLCSLVTGVGGRDVQVRAQADTGAVRLHTSFR